MLKIIEKVTLANNWQLMILGGYRDPSVVRKRINNLISGGYITAGWLGDHKVYTLSQAGLSELEKTRRPYEIKGIKSEHEELVTYAACLIYIRTGRSISDMLFDHELNSRTEFKGKGHKPDIVFSPHHALEIEISSKRNHSYVGKKGSKDTKTYGLEDNIKSNAENYGSQTWIIPSYKQGLSNRITEYAEKYGVSKRCQVMSIDDMKAIVSNYDSSSNFTRPEPVIGIPSPIHKQSQEIILND